MGRQLLGQPQERVPHLVCDSLNPFGIRIKSARCLGALLFGGLLVFSEGAIANAQNLKAGIGLSVVRFHYQEFNDAGSLLDTEQGGIPGLTLKLEWKNTTWVIESVASFHEGKVTYTGQTSFGAPYNTLTNEKVTDVALRVGKWFDARYPVMPYLGVGYHHWDRNILPGTIAGLFETYHWPYIWCGSQVRVAKEKSSQHLLEVGLLLPIKPQMQAVNYSPILYPESSLGLRGGVKSNFTLTQKTQITIEPFYEYWNLGRSPVSNSWYEPASKTHNVGINVQIGQDF